MCRVPFPTALCDYVRDYVENHTEIISLSDPQHYWIAAAQVVVANAEGVERQKGYNALFTTKAKRITRKNLAKAQELVMQRFVAEAEQVPGWKIIDVYIQSISSLGLMTEAQFHVGFAVPNAKQAPIAQDLN
jgi:hypothetical protein